MFLPVIANSSVAVLALCHIVLSIAAVILMIPPQVHAFIALILAALSWRGFMTEIFAESTRG
jgi:hypothetical protein